MTLETVSQASAEEVVGRSPCMQRLRQQVLQLAACDVNLLLQGESGTGKELVARTVHRLSGRRTAPFVGVNCAAIHETLLESELFGHEAGAFTGAQRPTPGLLRAAEGGTILFDEVGDMSLALQSKLLRVLEERAVVPVGGTRPVPIDLRVIAATHQDLARAVRDGAFREDLYYRLNVVCISIPPLRERCGDIPLLVEHMLRLAAEVLEMPAKQITAQALAALGRYHWPGNVRQLGNVIQRAYVLGQRPVIDLEDLPKELLSRTAEPARSFPTLRQARRLHVEQALETCGGVRSQAARMLGVDRHTLRRMMQGYGMA